MQKYLDGNRSNSASRGANDNGYDSHVYPIAYEQHNSNSRRSGGDFDRVSHFNSHNHRSTSNGDGLAHARYGSLSDSLRRGELKYIPNGEVREGQNNKRFHKSYSTRDVFNDQYYGGSGGHNGAYYQYHQTPLVEFPPTLPRGGRYGGFGDAPMPPPHRGSGGLTKSRSYADWDEGRGPFGSNIRRYVN